MSAQLPLCTWLTDAMQGPTPVSALIHAATMVTAGVYLVARCNVLYALAPVASAAVAGIGALTAFFAATIALKQWDIKRVLAYPTVSQLGYMFLGVGWGGYAAGIFHLVTRAFFKALLFLGAGSVIHALHHAYHATHSREDAQDMRSMGGLARPLPWTSTLMWVATLAIAGIPPFAGFFSKDQILSAAFSLGDVHPLWYVYWLLGLLTALLTAFYMTRLMLYTFHGPNRTGERESAHLHEAPWVMTGPLVVLAALSLAGGALNVPALLRGREWLQHRPRAAGVLRGAVRGRRPRRALDGGPLADVRALGADRAARLARRRGRCDSHRAAALGEAPGLRGELDRVRYRGPVVVDLRAVGRDAIRLRRAVDPGAAVRDGSAVVDPLHRRRGRHLPVHGAAHHLARSALGARQLQLHHHPGAGVLRAATRPDVGHDRGVRRPRPVPVLRDVGSDAHPDVLHHRGVGRGQPPVCGDQVLHLHDVRIAAHARGHPCARLPRGPAHRNLLLRLLPPDAEPR